MSAYRYSGQLRIRITYIEFDANDHYDDEHKTFRHPNGSYRCFMRSPDGDGDYTCIVGAPTYLSHGVDSSEAFDDIAASAIAFASHDSNKDRRNGKDYIIWDRFIAYNDDGIHIGRSKKDTWPRSKLQTAYDKMKNEGL